MRNLEIMTYYMSRECLNYNFSLAEFTLFERSQLHVTFGSDGFGHYYFCCFPRKVTKVQRNNYRSVSILLWKLQQKNMTNPQYFWLFFLHLKAKHVKERKTKIPCFPLTVPAPLICAINEVWIQCGNFHSPSVGFLVVFRKC